MLAPGEYLINPAPKEPVPLRERVRGTDQTPVATPTEQPKERPSFLLILLRALGAIHS
jgi:hypothetical protein